MKSPDLYLLDTSALSEFTFQEPHPSFKAWIRTVPESSLALSSSAVVETQRGIENVKSKNPGWATDLDRWLTALLGTDVTFLPTTPGSARLYGKMSSVPALKYLWTPDPCAKRPRLGQDLELAATAIAYQVPIVSANVRDFLAIHGRFRLPGLFDPHAGRWSIPCHGMKQRPASQRAGADLYLKTLISNDGSVRQIRSALGS